MQDAMSDQNIIGLPAGVDDGGTTVHPAIARWDARLRALNRTVASCGVVAMLGVALMTAADVIILRWLLNSPITASNEIFQLVFSVALASVLASGISERATLQVDIMKAYFSKAAVEWLKAIGAAVYAVVLALLFLATAKYSLEQWDRGAATTILRLEIGPFLVGMSVLFALCVPTQIVVAMDAAWALPGRMAGAVKVALCAAVALVLVLGCVALALTLQDWMLSNMVLSAAICFALLWVLVLLFMPLAAGLLLTAGIGIAGTFGAGSALSVSASETVSLLSSAELAIIPLFLLMGGFAVASGMSSDIYRFAHALFAPFRGGLAMATIGGCAGFGALTGSSVATVASIGAAAYPEMRARGYAPTLATGCIAAGGTLGQLIPPSTAVVVYALLVEQSIGALYIAILVPAALTILFYLITIAISVRLNPALAPSRSRWDAAEIGASFLRCIPVMILFFAVTGGIFTGIFTATEAASVGAVFAFVMTLMRGKMRGAMFWRVAAETTVSTSMVYFMIIGAMVMTFQMASTGVATSLTEFVSHTGLPPLAIVFLIGLIFVVLGTAMDSMTIMMITASTVAGVIVNLGYDPIWWGVIMIMLVELGVLSPPFGMNLFVLKGVAQDASISDVFRGVIPFCLADLVKIVILILVPAITLWLPSLL